MDGPVSRGLVSDRGGRGCGDDRGLLADDRTAGDLGADGREPAASAYPTDPAADRRSAVGIADSGRYGPELCDPRSRGGVGADGPQPAPRRDVGGALAQHDGGGGQRRPAGVMRMEFAAPADREDPPKEGAPGQTQRWIRGLQASARAAQRVPQVPCIAVMDREGDRYPGCGQCRPLPPPLKLLVRAHHHRVRGQGGPRRFETLRPAPAQARTEIEVQRSSARRSARGPQGQPLRTARRADCTLRWQPVTIDENPSSSGSRSLSLHAVHVQETSVPVDGSEPLEWRLLTTLSVREAAAAEQVLHYYRRRWRIEDWHRILKSGCKAEFLNLQSAEQLQRAIAIRGVIAWRLQALVLLGRETPELPAEVWFSDLEIRVRQDVARQRPRPRIWGVPCSSWPRSAATWPASTIRRRGTRSSGEDLPYWNIIPRRMSGSSQPTRNGSTLTCVQTELVCNRRGAPVLPEGHRLPPGDGGAGTGGGGPAPPSASEGPGIPHSGGGLCPWVAPPDAAGGPPIALPALR